MRPTSTSLVDALSRSGIQWPSGDLIRWNRHIRFRHGQQNVAMPLVRVSRSPVVVLEQVGEARIAVRPAIHGRSQPTLEYGLDVIAGQRPMDLQGVSERQHLTTVLLQ